jgi:hypothetical protein
MNKSGEIVTENAGEMILAIAALIVLVGAGIAFFYPEKDIVDKTSEAHFENLEKAILDAEAGRIGYFSIPDNGLKDLDFYLV